ncbi:hypothetical protein [Citrobacter sp. RHBSTW-00671]|uniref:hypothetical protein n=1 Tax=Citrobacter sp. RHBSTW-00671 TaxID=2742660 RepID=UPI002E134CF9
MAEFVVAMLVHTPVWVYVLLVFLLFRGIKARIPATVTLEKLALIPALFLFLGYLRSGHLPRSVHQHVSTVDGWYY